MVVILYNNTYLVCFEEMLGLSAASLTLGMLIGFSSLLSLFNGIDC